MRVPTGIAAVTVALVIAGCGGCDERWNRSFDPADEGPHGMSMLDDLLRARFPEAVLSEPGDGFGDSLRAADAAGELYVAVGPALAYDSAEVEALRDFVARGGRALLASHELSIGLTRAMFPGGCLGEAYDLYHARDFTRDDTLLTNRGAALPLSPVTRRRGGDDYAARLRTAGLCEDRLDILLEVGHASPSPGAALALPPPTSSPDTLDVGESEAPATPTAPRRTAVMTAVPHGRGHFLVLGAPVLLSNAYVAEASNRRSIEAILSYVGPGLRRIRFDAGRRSSVWEVELANRPAGEAVPPEREPLLREVFRRPALAAAWYLLLAGVLTFVLFGVKRVQRIVPVRVPRRNTTLAYLGNVSRLYLARPNNVLMARKQLGLFEAFCQRRFGLRPVHDPADRPRLAELRGVDPRLVEALARYENSLGAAQGLSNDAFLRLMHILRSLYGQLGRRRAVGP